MAAPIGIIFYITIHSTLKQNKNKMHSSTIFHMPTGIKTRLNDAKSQELIPRIHNGIAVCLFGMIANNEIRNSDQTNKIK